MDVDEYKHRVKVLLQSHRATNEMWDEALEAILWRSEDGDGCFAIDSAVGFFESEDVGLYPGEEA